MRFQLDPNQAVRFASDIGGTEDTEADMASSAGSQHGIGCAAEGAEAPLICPECHKQFATKSNLVKHFQYKHRPYNDDHAPDVPGPRVSTLTSTLTGTDTGAISAAPGVSEPTPTATAFEEEQPHTTWDKRVLQKLAHARVVRHTSRDVVQDFKETLADMCREVKKKIVTSLEQAPPDIPASVVVEKVFVAAEQITRRDYELDILRASDAYVKPVPRLLKVVKGGMDNEEIEQFTAYDGDLDCLIKQLAMDQEVWSDLSTFKERIMHRLRTSNDYSESLTIEDCWDGSEFGKFYLKLKIKGDEIPLIFMFYYDGLEVANGLGQARTTHELACFYWCLLNVRPELRTSHRYVRLATVCHKRAVGLVGMDAVLNRGSSSWGAHMQRYIKGVSIPTPAGEHTFVGATAIVAADTPAAAEMTGHKKAVGPTTKSCCRGCHCRQDGDPPPHRSPNSFLAGLPTWKRYCAGRNTNFTLRSSADLKAYLQKLQDVNAGRATAKDLTMWKQLMGINDFLGSMWTWPCYPVFTGCPQDIMHVLFEGIARQLLGAAAYVMITHWDVNPEDLVLAIKRHATAQGISRAEYPYVNSSRLKRLGEGTKGSLPRGDCDFPGTAIQLAHMILDVEQIWSHLIPAQEKRSLTWQLLLYESKVANLMWRRHFDTDSLLALDKAIWIHDKLWLGNKFTSHLWKPKNHYLSHVPLDILRWGPPRSYWCTPFEHENQYTKRAVSHGNYSNVVMSAAEAKALSVALDVEGDGGCR